MSLPGWQLGKMYATLRVVAECRELVHVHAVESTLCGGPDALEMLSREIDSRDAVDGIW